jgi:hypothetical protein
MDDLVDHPALGALRLAAITARPTLPLTLPWTLHWTLHLIS